MEVKGESIPSSSTNQAKHNESKARMELQKWIDETLRVDLVDGRVIIGTLACTDSSPNIILTGSEEYWLGVDGEELQCKRITGMVMIADRHIKRIFHVPKATGKSLVE